VIDEIQAQENLEEPPTETLFPLENVFDQIPLLDGRGIPHAKVLRDWRTTLEVTQVAGYPGIPICLRQDLQLHPQIVEPP
jgi:hypothetical protein